MSDDLSNSLDKNISSKRSMKEMHFINYFKAMRKNKKFITNDNLKNETFFNHKIMEKKTTSQGVISDKKLTEDKGVNHTNCNLNVQHKVSFYSSNANSISTSKQLSSGRVISSPSASKIVNGSSNRINNEIINLSLRKSYILQDKSKMKKVFENLNRNNSDLMTNCLLPKAASQLDIRSDLISEKQTPNSSSIKKYYLKNQVLSHFSAKSKDSIPLVFQPTLTFFNSYSSRSEQVRHRNLIANIRVLKELIHRNKALTLTYIRDFLNKYNFYEIDKYSTDQLLNIERIINTNFLLIHPVKDVKGMLSEILNFKGDWTKFSSEKAYVSPLIPPKKSLKPMHSKTKINFYQKANLNSQQKLYRKDKDYSSHKVLLVNDMIKELCIFERDLTIERNNLKPPLGATKSIDSFKFLTGFNKEGKVQGGKKGEKSLAQKEGARKKGRKLIKSSSMDDLVKPSLWEIVQRLYYKPLRKPITLDDYRKNKKLTELVALNATANNLMIKKEMKNDSLRQIFSRVRY